MLKSARRILVLVPHEPTVDPRVHYTAAALAKQHDVTMVATTHEWDVRPADNAPNDVSYTTVRLPYARRGAVAGCQAVCALLVERSLGLGRPISSFVGAVMLTVLGAAGAVVLCGWLIIDVLMLPFVLANEPRLVSLGLVFGAVRRTVWQTRRAARWLLSRLPGAAPKRGALTRYVERGVELIIGTRAAASVLRLSFCVSDQLVRCVLQREDRPDLLYVHDLYTLQAGVLLKRKTGATLVYDSHEYYPYQYTHASFTAIIRRYESLLLRWVDTYITVSPQLARELERTYARRPIHAIPNVEPSPPAMGPPAVTEMSALARDRVKVLYQGAFAEGRGLEEIIREWSGVDGSRAALFLRGPRNVWLGQLERIAVDLGLLGTSIYILPAVLERDLIAAAREADIGLIPYKGDWPSYRYACPNKLSQYLHAGLAIVSNRLPYIEEVLGDGNVGLCYDVDSDGSFSATMARFVKDPTLLEMFKQNAVAFARTRYNWERLEPVLQGLVRDTLMVSPR